ncbi:PLP-dependent aminotransferase family protein [Salinicoccus halitifaciens]|uniref:GntR family transcriptional regulator/MocR family aminotransferase n=1 Tax=Salinicoccus halitifaciens TaxID=1073415 RepID=A0ABV2E9S3_9STAP|nr:PLP-dependent aminotransferase family protein [Salinicoccus halitifaciens]MCD2138301.1 PLP-dependent aminotransferase family protein [Salinicoccus halitifaciens]
MYIKLDAKSETSLYEQVYQEMKRRILSGELKSRDKLPSKRQLEMDLNISMTTVERAYAQLLDEDLIYSVEKSGFFVSEIDLLKTAPKETPVITRPEPVNYNLSLGAIDTTIVQKGIIKQISREVFGEEDLLNPGEDSGEHALRKAIFDYLHFNRGVSCSIDQIFIGPSTEYLLQQALFLMDYPKMTIEDPGYPIVKKVLSHLKLSCDIAEVEEDGINIEDVKKHENPVVHITPSHQFPSGAVLSMKKRVKLLNYAFLDGKYIIEDDYDSEFRYTGRPLPSLQGLDRNERTIYMSTFSKSLYPSLRLSVMVLPKPLAEKYYAEKLSCNVSRQMQHIVARYISEGYLNRHINRVRKIYSRKMKEITDWLGEHFPQVRVSGEHTGMHFVLKCPGRDIGPDIEAYGLISKNNYSVSDHFNDAVIIGIGEAKTEEIIGTLSHFLGDVYK